MKQRSFWGWLLVFLIPLSSAVLCITQTPQIFVYRNVSSPFCDQIILDLGCELPNTATLTASPPFPLYNDSACTQTWSVGVPLVPTPTQTHGNTHGTSPTTHFHISAYLSTATWVSSDQFQYLLERGVDSINMFMGVNVFNVDSGDPPEPEPILDWTIEYNGSVPHYASSTNFTLCYPLVHILDDALLYINTTSNGTQQFPLEPHVFFPASLIPSTVLFTDVPQPSGDYDIYVNDRNCIDPARRISTASAEVDLAVNTVFVRFQVLNQLSANFSLSSSLGNVSIDWTAEDLEGTPIDITSVIPLFHPLQPEAITDDNPLVWCGSRHSIGFSLEHLEDDATVAIQGVAAAWSNITFANPSEVDPFFTVDASPDSTVRTELWGLLAANTSFTEAHLVWNPADPWTVASPPTVFWFQWIGGMRILDLGSGAMVPFNATSYRLDVHGFNAARQRTYLALRISQRIEYDIDSVLDPGPGDLPVWWCPIWFPTTRNYTTAEYAQANAVQHPEITAAGGLSMVFTNYAQTFRSKEEFRKGLAKTYGRFQWVAYLENLPTEIVMALTESINVTQFETRIETPAHWSMFVPFPEDTLNLVPTDSQSALVLQADPEDSQPRDTVGWSGDRNITQQLLRYWFISSQAQESNNSTVLIYLNDTTDADPNATCNPIVGIPFPWEFEVETNWVNQTFLDQSFDEIRYQQELVKYKQPRQLRRLVLIGSTIGVLFLLVCFRYVWLFPWANVLPNVSETSDDSTRKKRKLARPESKIE